MTLNTQRNSRTVGEEGLSTERDLTRKRLAADNGGEQSSGRPVSNNIVSDVVESVISKTTDYIFGNGVLVFL
jgi:hypothetical protein